MSSTPCSAPRTAFGPHTQSGLVVARFSGPKLVSINGVTQSSEDARLQALVVKATDDKKSTTKSNSILCADCEGNGVKQCTQCKGLGVNSVDHFNGQFKAGALCWLCRGRKEILCGNCNGAGFVGGFLSTTDS